jgi:methionyl aminopeptidase
MIQLKTPEEIQIMLEGGKKLARVKNALSQAVKAGVRASDIEDLAVKLIKEEGAEASFKKVPGYHWATCINVNEGLVHGIPVSSLIFRSGDLVSIDVGVYYKGFHTDTSISVGINLNLENQRFFNIGQEALNKALKMAKEGNYIYDISEVIEDSIEKAGYTTIKALVGHGIGRELHEEPQIPCFVPLGSARGKPAPREESSQIKIGMVLAVEIMYAFGSDKVEVSKDGWTIAMKDGKISGLFEETVAVTEAGPKVLTR